MKSEMNMEKIFSSSDGIKLLRSSSESRNNLSTTPSSKDQKIRASSKIDSTKDLQSKLNLANPNAEESQRSKFNPNSNNKSMCTCCYNFVLLTYKTPRCIKHEYCSKCIEKGSDLRCEYCSIYFESLTRVHNPQIFTCSLCKLFPNSPTLRCGHNYCHYCFKFLVQNDFSHIRIVANCQECNNYINEMKIKNSSSQKINNSQEVKPQVINIIQNSNEYRSPKFIPKSNEANLLTSQNLIDQNLNQHNFVAQNYKNPYIKNPEPNKQNGPIRPGTYKQALSPRSNNANLQILFKTAKPIPAIHNPVKPKIAEYPIIQPSFQTSPVISYNLSNSITIDSSLLIKCSQCQGRENVKGFLCNHNICAECLVKGCCSQIKKFMIEFFQCNRESIFKFSYFYCTYNGCGRPISVPTKMLKIYLIKFLNDPDRKSEFSQFSDLIYTLYLDVWIAYYDGLI